MTCLIYRIDKCLHVIPKEATDRVALIRTGEYDFKQGGEFMQRERASDQTSAGGNFEVGRAGVISTLSKIDEDGAKDIPLSDTEVVAGVRECTGRVLSGGVLGALRVSGVSGVSWFLNLRPSTLLLLCLTRGIFAPLLSVRSISYITLELLDKGVERARAGQHTFPDPRVPPSQTR